MKEEIYIFELADQACPSFCTGYKQYAGSLDDVKIVYSEIKKKIGNRKDCHYEIGVTQSMEKYFNGDKNAINEGIYGEVPIFVTTNIIDRCKHEIQNKEVIHYGVWDEKIKLRFTKCLVENIITQNKEDNDNGIYRTFVKFTFYNLEEYSNYTKKWEKIAQFLIKRPTENPGILKVNNEESKNNSIYTPVYLQNYKFKDLNAAKEYISDVNKINYSTAFNEYFTG